MFTAGDVRREALDLWQNPPVTELPPETVMDAFNRALSRRFLDLDLTPNASFLAQRSKPFTFSSPDAREKNISSIGDLSRILRVESRALSSVSDDDWIEERITDFENWNDTMERTDGNFVAFYGTPPALTMIVSGDVSAYEFRIVYEQQQAAVTSDTADILLPDNFKPLLVYDLALEFGELIDNQSPEFAVKKKSKMVYLLERQSEAKAQIDRWRKAQKGTSITTRRGFNDRQTTFNTRRRRFSITY